MIASLIRVDLQPSGSSIPRRNLPVSLCVSCSLSTTLVRIIRRLVRISRTEFLAFFPKPWTAFVPHRWPICSHLTMNTAQALCRLREVIRRQTPSGEWRLDKAQQNGAFLKKWPQMWSVGAGNQDQFPANRGFRARAGCQQRRRDQGGRPPRGHPHPGNAEGRMMNDECRELHSGFPEATLRPSGGQPVGTRKPP